MAVVVGHAVAVGVAVTLGVAVGGGPELTTTVTMVPGCTCWPASGVVLMTRPKFTVVLDCTWMLYFRPALVSVSSASCCVLPINCGTGTLSKLHC